MREFVLELELELDLRLMRGFERVGFTVIGGAECEAGEEETP